MVQVNNRTVMTGAKVSAGSNLGTAQQCNYLMIASPIIIKHQKCDAHDLLHRGVHYTVIQDSMPEVEFSTTRLILF
ncbi:hypothetical protein MKW98_001493 [Papaver atlanticum]|uniref:Uncharacterized protein n=1 Tax=Papaver atlanticum TaxID=357466 RepID=A0AAD4SXH1_9MAGN|nr:hypothetical protein MKW98_001493 [Papaver atlanticum]